jgi:succinate dehydrogenase / fumarate reductase cytochrome b subunit
MRNTLPEPVPGSGREASAPDAHAHAHAHAQDAHAVRRVLSLCGLVPLGAFLLVHLAINASALRGGWAFARTAVAVQDFPLLPLIEWLFVFAPLAVHAGLGTWLLVRGRTLEPPRPYPHPVRLAMRGAAVGALLFVMAHLAEIRFRAPGVHLDPGALATLLDADLSATAHGVPWAGVAYLVGTACVTFHFACGAWGAYATGRAGRASARRRRRAAWVALGAGVAMWALFADVVVLRSTGSALFGASLSADAPPGGPCPLP